MPYKRKNRRFRCGFANRHKLTHRHTVLIGQKVELKTEEQHVVGIVEDVNPCATVFFLRDARELTKNIKILGVCCIGGVKEKKVLSNREEEDISLPNVCNSSEEDSKPKKLQVPDEALQRSSQLFYNLRGRPLVSNEQPFHLQALSNDDHSHKLGLAKAVLNNNYTPCNRLDENQEHEGEFLTKKRNISKANVSDVDDGTYKIADSLEPIFDIFQTKLDLNSEPLGLDSVKVTLADTSMKITEASRKLKSSKTLGLSIQGDLRENPAKVSVICFSTETDIVAVDFISIGANIAIVRDCFQVLLESNDVLKVCIECGIVREVLRYKFNINLVNVFDPQVVDGYLAAGHNRLNMVPPFYYGLNTLVRLYTPQNAKYIPSYWYKYQVDFEAWLDRPLKPLLVDIAVGEVKVLIPLYKVQQNRINAQCATLINARLKQFEHKKYFPSGASCEVDPQSLRDPREIMEKRSSSVILQSKRLADPSNIQVNFTINIQ